MALLTGKQVLFFFNETVIYLGACIVRVCVYIHGQYSYLKLLSNTFAPKLKPSSVVESWFQAVFTCGLGLGSGGGVLRPTRKCRINLLGRLPGAAPGGR